MEQVSFLDNGTKVAAVNTKTYIFQRNMSRGPESDLIRTVNVPAMVSDLQRLQRLHLLHPPPRFPVNSHLLVSLGLVADGDDHVQGSDLVGQPHLRLHERQK